MKKAMHNMELMDSFESMEDDLPPPTNILAQMMRGILPAPVPVKVDPERAEWQRRSDEYATVKPAVLAALAELGTCTPQQLVDKTGINLISVRRALRRLGDDGTAKRIRPAQRGQGKAPAIWTIVTDPPRSTDVPCEACGAGVDEWCKNNRGERRKKTHQVRITAYRATKEKHHA